MENTFENALIYVRHLDQIDDGWSESERTLASAMMSYAAKTVKNIVNEPLLGVVDVTIENKAQEWFFNLSSEEEDYYMNKHKHEAVNIADMVQMYNAEHNNA